MLWSDADGTVIGTDWAEGFMQGVSLRATKWERLFRSEDGAGLIFPILALCGDENGESLARSRAGGRGPHCGRGSDPLARLRYGDRRLLEPATAGARCNKQNEKARSKRSLPLRLW